MNKKEAKRTAVKKGMVQLAKRLVAIALVMGTFVYSHPEMTAFAASNSTAGTVLKKTYRDSGSPATVRTTTTDTLYATVTNSALHTEPIAAESLIHIHNYTVGSMTTERGTGVTVGCSSELSVAAGYQVGTATGELQATIGVTTEATVSTSVSLTINVPAAYGDGYYQPVVTIPGKRIRYSIEENVRSVNTSNTVLSNTTREIYAWTVEYSPLEIDKTFTQYLRWKRTGDLLEEDYQYIAD